MSDRSIEDYCYYQSPIGFIRMGETGGFMTRADFLEQSPESEHLQSDRISNSSTLLKDACRQLDEYFEGRRKKFDLALKPHGTDFQTVLYFFQWVALKIGFGGPNPLISKADEAPGRGK